MMRPNEDAVVMGKVAAALGEMGYIPDDYAIRDSGPHRIYIAEITLRDDAEFIEADFIRLLGAYNCAGVVNPHLLGVEEYPAEAKNFSRVYITVYT